MHNPNENEQEGIWAEFDEAGEAKLRTWIKLRRFHGPRLAIAERWLEVKDQERGEELERVKQASSSESLNVARSAKDAAWAAARAARSANTIATVALIAAIIAIAVSVLDAFLG